MRVILVFMASGTNDTLDKRCYISNISNGLIQNFTLTGKSSYAACLRMLVNHARSESTALLSYPDCGIAATPFGLTPVRGSTEVGAST